MKKIQLVAIVVALVIVGASCGSSDSDEESSPVEEETAETTVTATESPTASPTETATAEPTSTAAPTTTSVPSTTSEPPVSLVPEEGGIYVALGSSIASGFGISEQSDCGRSDRNYPNLVASEFALALTDVSCGGAEIPNVLDTPQGDNPPQIEAVSPDTALITVTVGGNDIGYNGTALGCSDPATICEGPENFEENLATLRPELTAMIEALRTTAPDATIVLVTYPREFPDTNCPELSMADEEFSMLLSMGEQLEQAFVDVAAETGVIFVDPYPEPGDHTGCAPEADRWVSGAAPVEGDGFAFHPTALGHQVMAEMIIAALTEPSG